MGFWPQGGWRHCRPQERKTPGYAADIAEYRCNRFRHRGRGCLARRSCGLAGSDAANLRKIGIGRAGDRGWPGDVVLSGLEQLFVVRDHHRQSTVNDGGRRNPDAAHRAGSLDFAGAAG